MPLNGTRRGLSVSGLVDCPPNPAREVSMSEAGRREAGTREAGTRDAGTRDAGVRDEGGGEVVRVRGKRQPNGAPVVDRALALLDCFDHDHRYLTLTMLSRRSGIPASSVLRL